MAKTCPRCRRPNSDQAGKCIYCSSPFPDDSSTRAEAGLRPVTSQATPPGKKPAHPKPEPPEAFLVIQSPVERFDPNRLQPYCELTGFDPSLAKQRFKSEVPWVVRVFKELAPAQEFLSGLTGLGLDAYLLKQSGIRKLEAKLEVRGLRFREDGISFLTEAGEEVLVRYPDLFLIVKGRIQVQPEREDTEDYPLEVSLGALIVGAAGDREENPEDPLIRLKQQARRIKFRPQERHQRMFYRGQESQVMDLYLQTSRIGVRVIESAFDFSGMGERKLASAMLNFNTIFRDLKDHAPQALVDDHFKKINYVLEQAQEKDQLRTQLQELGASSGAKKLYDNKVFFTDYSTRLYLHHLRQAKTAKPA